MRKSAACSPVSSSFCWRVMGVLLLLSSFMALVSLQSLLQSLSRFGCCFCFVFFFTPASSCFMEKDLSVFGCGCFQGYVILNFWVVLCIFPSFCNFNFYYCNSSVYSFFWLRGEWSPMQPSEWLDWNPVSSGSGVVSCDRYWLHTSLWDLKSVSNLPSYGSTLGKFLLLVVCNVGPKWLELVHGHVLQVGSEPFGLLFWTYLQ